jgi:hypothetical protein
MCSESESWQPSNVSEFSDWQTSVNWKSLNATPIAENRRTAWRKPHDRKSGRQAPKSQVAIAT